MGRQTHRRVFIQVRVNLLKLVTLVHRCISGVEDFCSPSISVVLILEWAVGLRLDELLSVTLSVF